MSDSLPIHYAGTVGNDGLILTVIGTEKEGEKVTAIHCSGAAANDANAIKQYDKCQLLDDVPGLPNIRPIVIGFGGLFIGKDVLSFMVNTDYGSDSMGHVWLDLSEYCGLEKGDTVTEDIMPGMQIKVLPDYRVRLMGIAVDE